MLRTGDPAAGPTHELQKRIVTGVAAHPRVPSRTPATGRVPKTGKGLHKRTRSQRSADVAHDQLRRAMAVSRSHA